ncbi:derlin-1 isoform X2 [Globicephala melas]|uniref:derlin-1 isoform X2 n=1 Tax=Globicephala melas TaxID=9731 RepID=UPI00293D4190|nr:derlin-1 isoform X2 [Globicephala melas]
MSDIGDWFRSIPAITRYWFAATVAVPLVGKLGLISPAYFFLWPEAFLYRFQIWRPITATFYFPVGPGTGFLYLVNLYFLYQYSTRLETGAFDGRPADYLFMLLFNWICIVITGLAMDMQLLMIPLIMSVLYVWAQLNRDMIVSFWFGTRFKACYLPWVILGFNYIIGGSVINELIGNLVGHLYFFLMFRYPMDLGGRNFLSTPQFLLRNVSSAQDCGLRRGAGRKEPWSQRKLDPGSATSELCAEASHCCGLSHCGAQAPDAQAQRPWLTGPAAPRHVGSSWTRARTRVPCISRRTLNHCATREALGFIFYI